MDQYRTLELKINFAKDIKNLNFFSKMDVYAVVSISGDYNQNQKVKTPIDKEGGTHPTWNFPIKLAFNETLARQNRLILEIHLRCKAFPADKDIGTVHVPLAEILNNPGDGKSFQHVSYQVRRASGRHKGALNFSYKLGDTVAAQEKPSPSHKAEPAAAYPPPPAKNQAEPVVAYPPPATASSSYGTAYPPPPPEKQQYPAGFAYPAPGAGYPHGQPAYGYPPQQPGYGYPPPQSGYGYPPPQQGGYGYGYARPQQGYGYPGQGQKPGRSNFGPGLGLGLLGGAVGGLLLGDMVSDAFDDGYGAGFDF